MRALWKKGNNEKKKQNDGRIHNEWVEGPAALPDSQRSVARSPFHRSHYCGAAVEVRPQCQQLKVYLRRTRQLLYVYRGSNSKRF